MLLCGDSIFARSWGSATTPIILCWHGAGGSSDDYAEIAPALAERLDARVVAIDAPGHAQSATPQPEEVSPAALATLATDVLDELGSERAVFVGFSWGATVGCWLAALHPERTLALVLIEGGHLDFADVPGFQNRSLEELVSEATDFAASQGDAFGSYTPAVAGAMIYGLSREPAAAAYPRLAAAGTPTLFVGAQGDDDTGGLERLARLVPQTEIVQLPSSGHEVLRDAPEAVSRAVGDWLS